MAGLSKIQIFVVVGFLLMLISIPLAFLLLKDSQIFSSKAKENNKNNNKNQATTQEITSGTATKPRAIPTNSPLTDFQKLISDTASLNPISSSGTDTTDSSGQLNSTPTPSPTPGISYGATLSFKINTEGRPDGRQANKIFVGISLGATTTKPTYLVTFTVDVPESGLYEGLSLAGLNPGSVYTVYLKGSAQIDSLSTFTMSPTTNTLAAGAAINLITGDLNEDNTINTLDYSIERALYGKTASSAGWNPNADFNKDGIINTYDLAYIVSNLGKTGASGTWFSTPPASTPSATPSPTTHAGGPQDFGELINYRPNSSESTTTNNSASNYWLLVP